MFVCVGGGGGGSGGVGWSGKVPEKTNKWLTGCLWLCGRR